MHTTRQFSLPWFPNNKVTRVTNRRLTIDCWLRHEQCRKQDARMYKQREGGGDEKRISRISIQQRKNQLWLWYNVVTQANRESVNQDKSRCKCTDNERRGGESEQIRLVSTEANLRVTFQRENDYDIVDTHYAELFSAVHFSSMSIYSVHYYYLSLENREAEF